MGAWGHGYFEDDSALDFVAEVESHSDPKNLFRESLETAIDSEYLDYSDATAVIVACAYIDRQILGTPFSSPEQEEPMGVDTFSERNPGIDLSDLRQMAVNALKKVIGENSELNELWEENEEEYPLWKAGIEEMIGRLES